MQKGSVPFLALSILEEKRRALSFAYLFPSRERSAMGSGLCSPFHHPISLSLSFLITLPFSLSRLIRSPLQTPPVITTRCTFASSANRLYLSKLARAKLKPATRASFSLSLSLSLPVLYTYTRA